MAKANNPNGNSSLTANLLPKYYQTPANKKFLQATLDQLFQPGTVTKTNGFIGRENAKAATGADNYVASADITRQNYQLEPGIVIKDSLGNIKFFKDYIDYINQIGVFGGNTKNHARLNEQELYSWDPHINWDKFINFQNYYWLPYGPDVVRIFGQQQKISSTYSVLLQNEGANNQYLFTPDGFTPNPILKLYKGHTYTFVINSPGNPFSIKTERSPDVINRYKTDGIDNYGVTNGTITFTVPLDAPSVLYYQSETDINLGGSIEVYTIDENTFIDVEHDFLGKKAYKLSDGTQISNGMRVTFGGNVIPASYATGEYYVEGVGDAIKLVPTDVLEIITPYTVEQASEFDNSPFESQPFSDATGYASIKDYITINRASRDHNPWSRYNRWFHQDVIKASAEHSGGIPMLDQNARAIRPIIEFTADLKLFNFGTKAIADVDLIDTFTTDIFSIIEGSSGYSIDGKPLLQGQRVLFTADTDPLVVNKIYQVDFIDVKHLSTGSKQIHLIEVDTPALGDVTIIKDGMQYYSQMFWFDGTTWIEAQQKIDTNQAPLFDIVDNNGISYGDHTVYNGSTFKGTNLFSYKVGNGIADTVLGFALSYQNVANIGDIVFNFNLATDTFQYKESTNLITQKIDVGYLLGQDYAGNPTYENGWQVCASTTIQPAVRVYKNSNLTTKFTLDIFDDIKQLDDLVVRVYINGIRLSSNNWKLVDTAIYKQVVLRTQIASTDVVTIKAFAKQPINSNGHYEIPINLQNNPLNDSMADFTLGEVSDHVSTIVDNIDFTGKFPGSSNLRDLGNITKFGTRFVQHSGPLSLSLYHVNSESTNVIRAIETARDDYSSFKRNFISVAGSLGVDASPIAMVDLILQKLNANKPDTAPYYFSDMVPYGAKLITELDVVDYRTKQYPLTSVFTLDSLSHKAVAVYQTHNGVTHQLAYGQDYTFDAQGYVNITAELHTGDVLTTYEYESTDGCFVPATPTKLGIWPKYVPRIYMDTTVNIPDGRLMIQGHDGSQTLAFGDYRDEILLELEKRIFNNIKVQYDSSIFDINDIIPSYNRPNSYSLDEFNAILAPSFYKWTSLIGSDFSKPLNYDIADPFTYNYSRSTTPDGTQNVPGYWRGIYRWILDTDRPNICPWEMLGFTVMPTWWIDLYGPAPYTGDNLVMWQDIADGAVRAPGKPVVYLTKYAKPFLMNSIPVDSAGNLLNPTITGLARGRITPSIDGDYIFGDVAPVEAAWRRSSYFPFSVIVSSLLMTPAKTFGVLLDRSRIVRNLAGQLIYKDTGLRVRPMDITLPSLYSSKHRVQTSGIINYVVDLILNYIFSNNLANYNSYASDLALMVPQLSYRVGAFTNKDQFNLLLESKTPLSTGNVFIPKEDYNIFLNTSSAVKKLTYSGVMITKLQTGYQVRGYSKTQPYFYYYNFAQTGSVINIGGISQSYVEWTPGQQYMVGTFVSYNNKYYRTTVTNTATDTFTPAYFAPLSKLPTVGGVEAMIRKSWDKSEVITVPYGTEFATVQEVVDFLMGYGEYLKDQGFEFDDYNNNLGVVLNWETSAKEFLFWSTQNWSTGQDKWSDWRPNQPISYGTILRYEGEYYSAVTNIPASPEFNFDDFTKLNGLSIVGASVISLSPSAAAVKFKTSLTVVDDISNKFNSYEIFKVDGTPITPHQLDSYREGNTVTYAPRTTDGIYSASFYLIQNEHVIIINNTDIFNDIIYSPTSGYRRERIKVSGYITTDWYGGLDIPGFIFDAATVQSWQPWQDYNMGDIIAHQGHYYSANVFLPGTSNFVSNSWTIMATPPSPQILPNWTNIATQFTDFYSLEVDSFDAQQQKMAQHLVGYQKRQYLENIIQDDVSEFKFYQGMIREKGTQNVLNKLFNVLSSDLVESLTFYEEWALRVGQYGASQAFEDVEFVLDEGAFKSNPQAVSLVEHFDPTINSFVIQQTTNDVYLKPKGYTSNPFPLVSTYQPLLRSAGYVNPSDVFVSLGQLSEILNQDIAKFNNGAYVWVAFEETSWNIYRYTDMNVEVVDVTYNANTKELTIKTMGEIGVTAGSYIGIDQVTQFSGFYQINSVSLNSFTITVNIATWITPFTEQNRITLYALVSQRASSIDNIDSVLTSKLTAGELLWTDDSGNGNWASWKFNPTYKMEELQNSTSASGAKFGNIVAVSRQGNLMAASDSTGRIITYYKTNNTLSWAEKQIIDAPTISSNTDINMATSALSFSADGTWLAVGSRSASNVSSANAGLWDSATDYPAGSVVKYYDQLYKTDTAIQHEYQNVTGKSISTNVGTGAIFDVVIVPTATTTVNGKLVPTSGYYNVNVKYGGVGYHVGQKIKISGIQLGGRTPDDDVTVTIVHTSNPFTGIGLTVNDITFSGAPTSKFNGVLLANTTANVGGTVVPGSGAAFNVTTPTYGYRLGANGGIAFAGSGYITGDQIIIAGSQLGGQDVINDLIITVVATNGAVTSYTLDGASTWKPISYTPAAIQTYGKLVETGSLAVGDTYEIAVSSTTDFTALGASSNVPGTMFVATGTGRFNSNQIIQGKEYLIITPGTSNFTLIGATSNLSGTTFVATDNGTTGTGVVIQGTGVVIEQLQAVDSALTSQGVVTLYKKDNNGFYNLVNTVISPEPLDHEQFGTSLEFGTDKLFVGARGADNGAGRIYTLEYKVQSSKSATYNPEGSLGTTIVLSSIPTLNADTGILEVNPIPVLNIYPGMAVRGIGFTSGQTVVQIINATTITISAAPDHTPDGTLTFVNTDWGYAPAGTILGSEISVSNLGSIIKLSADNSTLVTFGLANGFGRALVYNNYTSLHQQLVGSTSRFGASIAVSADGNYIAVGDDTDSGKVIVYKLDNTRYIVEQELVDHNAEVDGGFGSKVAFMNGSSTLVVYSSSGDTVTQETFDHATTTFDKESTQFVQSQPNSGRIDIFDRYATKWVFGESLLTTETSVDGYGTGFAVGNDQVLIGAPFANEQAGQVFSYTKPTGKYSWTIDRQQTAIPDVKKVKQAFLYNKKLGELVKHLDVVDPLQGKVPGFADEELRYKSFYDPAVYSTTTTSIDVNLDSSSFWSKTQIGQLWWNLSTAKFLHTYFDEVSYRSNSWNTLAPGASIDVYEWVESRLLPAAWDLQADTPAGLSNGISGTSLYGNSAYSERQQYNSITKTFVKTYYFWVKNKAITPNVAGRNMTAMDVASLIGNPRGQDYTYLALLGADSFSLTNARNYLNGTDVVLAVEYWLTEKTDQNIHSQWKLISNDPIVDLPHTIEQKWFDSLCGVDTVGRSVPDLTQPLKLRYGIENRPRQSMFVNRIEALKEFVERVNLTLATSQIAENYNISSLDSYDTPPKANTGLYDKVLDVDTELSYLNIESFRKAVLTPVIVNGTITSVDITFAGSGYLIAPTVTIIGPGKDAVVKTTVNTLGQITGVRVINGGIGYDSSNTTITVRTFCVLTSSDTQAGGNWSVYAYEPSTRVWSRILTQAYDVRNYWNYIDWYATGYSQYSAADHAVNTFVDLNKIQVKIGELVKVRTVNAGGWLLLEKYATSTSVDWTQSYTIVGIEKGTIQLSSKLYNFEATNIGYDSDTFDGGSFDIVAATELRIILNTIKNNIFIGSLKQNYLDLFIAAIHYAHSEQVYLDWAFKTSFVRATHTVGKLDQPVNYPVDNISNFEDYVSEVKPYRTKLREYISNYVGNDLSQTAVSDFDLQPAFSNNRVLSVDTVYADGKITSNSDLLNQYPWKFWKDNVGYVVTDLILVSQGNGYVTPPEVIIESNSGTGATAKAFITNGVVSRVVLLTPGSGYLSAPTITISGGLGIGGKAATVTSVIGKGVVRSSLIGMKFDRINSAYYIANINKQETFTGSGSKLQFALKWAPDVRIGQSSVTINGIPVLRELYTFAIVKKKYNGYTQFTGTITFSSAPAKGSSIVVKYVLDQSMLSATDRIQYFYKPVAGQLGKELTQLMTGVDYGGVTVNGLGFDFANGWDAGPFVSDKWDSFDSNFDDFFVTVSANQHLIQMPYLATPGTEINVYRTATNVDTHTIVNPAILKYSYNILSTAIDVTASINAQTSSVTTTYNSIGSYLTTVKVASSLGISKGMFINGVGFASAQLVTDVIDIYTIVISSAPDSAPTPGATLKFTFNYPGSNTLSLASTANIDLGDVVTCNDYAMFAYDVIVQKVDATTVTLGSYNISSSLSGSAISGDGTTATITFGTQTRIFYPVGSVISVSGFIPSKYNGLYTVTASSLNSVSFASTISAPATKFGSVTSVVDSIVFNDTASTPFIPDATTINFVKTLVDTTDITININGTVELITPLPVGTVLTITGKTDPIRLDDAKYATVDQTNSHAIMETPFPVFSTTVTEAGKYDVMPSVTFGPSDLNPTVYTATGNAVMKAVDISYRNNGTGYTIGDILIVSPPNGPANVDMLNSSIENTTLIVGTVTGTIHIGMILTGSGVAQLQSVNTLTVVGDGTTATVTFINQPGFIPFALGQTIVITGLTPTQFNGTFIVTDATDHSVSFLSTVLGTNLFAVLGTITSREVTYITGNANGLTGAGSHWTINRKQTTASTTITGNAGIVTRLTKVASFTEVGPVDELQILSTTTFTNDIDATAYPLSGGTGADATIGIVYGVDSIELTNVGGGYLNNPSVTITAGMTVNNVVQTAKASATIRQVSNGTSYTVVTIPDSYTVHANDEFILRRSTSDGSRAPANVDYDTAITGGTTAHDLAGAYTTATGLLADDIVIDGDDFVTPTSSPATEEVVPGQVVDTLAIKVFDEVFFGAAKVKVATYVANGNTSIFALGQPLSGPSAVIVKVDGIIKVISKDFQVNFSAGNVQLFTAPSAGQIVSLFSLGNAVRHILDGNFFIGDGVTTEFITRAPWLKNIQSIVYVNDTAQKPVLFRTDKSYELTNMVGLRFSVAPPLGAAVNYTLSEGKVQSFSITETQVFQGNGGTSYPLINPVGVGLPMESNMIVIVDQQILEAPSNSYYTIAATDKLAYTVLPNQFTPNTVKYEDVRVYIDKKLIVLNKDYTVDLAGVTVTLRKALRDKSVGKQLVISIRTFAGYSYDTVTKEITFPQIYTIANTIQVLTSYNHDMLDLQRTTINVGSSIVTDPTASGYKYYQNLSRGFISVNRAAIDTDYVWVIKNGSLLIPNTDYIILDDRTTVHLAVPPIVTDRIELLSYGNDIGVRSRNCYMQFKDMLNRVVYKRITLNKQSSLAQDLHWYDTEIVVANALNFDIPDKDTNRPGIIEIQGERIEYFELSGNTLSRLRRATLGTGLRQLYKAGAKVQDIGVTSTVPYTDTILTDQVISDGVSKVITVNFGATLDSNFANQNSLFEVFVGGESELVRLKKSSFKLYNPALGPYSNADTDELHAPDFTVTNVTATSAEIDLAKIVTQGTQITVVKKTGTVWDGDKSTNPLNISYDKSAIASFIQASEGVWYSGFKNTGKTTFDSVSNKFDSDGTTFDQG